MNLLMANLPVLARFLVGFYFAFYGVWNIYHWRPIISAMNRDNVPHPYLLLPAGIVWQFFLGILIMANLYVKLAAVLLLPFTFIAIIIFHPYWRYQGELRILNFSIFITQLCMTVGALLQLIGPLHSFADLLT